MMLTLDKHRTLLRQQFQKARKTLAPERKAEAKDKLRNLYPELPAGIILSYASFKEELDTSELNALLASRGRLALPKVDGERLRIFYVPNLNKLQKNAWGILEPLEGKEIPLAAIGTVLVPGIAFDQRFHRLGYGKGYYDRFLPRISPSVPKIGLGYQEQLFVPGLPVSPFDFPLTSLLLY